MTNLVSWFTCGTGSARRKKDPEFLTGEAWEGLRKLYGMEEEKSFELHVQEEGAPMPERYIPPPVEVRRLDEEVELDAPQEGFDSQVRHACLGLLDEWAGLGSAQLAVEKVSGGITNILVRVTVLDHKAADRLPAVAVRVFGPNTEFVIDRAREHQILRYLSSAGVGPKLLGTFKNGFIMSFIKARTLQPWDMADRAMVPLVAEAVRRFHDVLVPGPKVPQLWLEMRKLYKLACDLDFENSSKQVRYSTINFDELARQLQQMEEVCLSLDAPVVLCHNDLLSGNFMYDDRERVLHLIDFEYSAWGYRGYDIGNHFNEYAGFDCDFSLYPEREQQFLFFWYYLAPERRAAAAGRGMPELTYDAVMEGHEHSCVSCVGPNTSNIHHAAAEVLAMMEKLYVEANCFALASHLYWGLWAIVQARHSPIEFDYLNYFFLRYDEYKNRKAEVLATLNEYRLGVDP